MRMEQSLSGDVAMPDLVTSLAQLDELAAELARRGETELAEKARAATADLRSATATPTDTARELMSTRNAAHMLGIGSSSTVVRWAREGLLEGFKVGAEVKASRTSVERML